MIILSIETSCDETAVSIIEATGPIEDSTFTIRGDALFSQINIHREYGGVFPAVAKREHARTLVPMLQKALKESDLESSPYELSREKETSIREILSREQGLADAVILFATEQGMPSIDLIAVTEGPGLEPALWVGINFAKALGALWDIPVAGINHMEGHVFASLFDGEKISAPIFPAIALLISGGHTELVLMRDFHTYELIGKTRDDAVGEAFDKVGRMLALPYPGGPEISARAQKFREKVITSSIELPRPMLNTADCDFSFSGLKTAVLYYLKNTMGAHEDTNKLTEEIKEEVSFAFEEAATEVLVKKTTRAVDIYGGRSLIIGGGVSANKHIREVFTKTFQKNYPEVKLYLPKPGLTGDNSIMIALAAYAKYNGKSLDSGKEIRAQGNFSISTFRV